MTEYQYIQSQLRDIYNELVKLRRDLQASQETTKQPRKKSNRWRKSQVFEMFGKPIKELTAKELREYGAYRAQKFRENHKDK